MRKPDSMKLFIGLGIVAAVIASVVAFGYFWPASPELTLSGQVQAREVKNGSRFGGRVKQILVQEGQAVTKGQVLVIFDEVDLQSKIAEAKAALAQAMAQEQLLARGANVGDIRQAGSATQQAEQRAKMLSRGARPEEITQGRAKVQAAQSAYNKAKEAMENSQVMLDEGIISRQKYDEIVQAAANAQSNLESARAALKIMETGARSEEVKIAQAQVSAARAQYNELLKGAKPEEMRIASANVDKAQSALQALESQRGEVKITAPFSGNVTTISVSEGELVGPGRPVISILDYGNLWTDVYVPESRLSAVTPDAAVRVEAPSYKGTYFNGKIALINPRSEFIPNAGGETTTEEANFRVKVTIGNTDVSGQKRLYPGMKVNVLFGK